jgi:hypothetical protein
VRGTILTIKPGKALSLVLKLDKAVTLEQLKAAIGGGYLEAIPRFNSIEYEGEVRACIAFCDEDGKRKSLPTNNRATLAWEVALRRTGHPGLLDVRGRAVDWLVGDIAIVFGDDEFMEAL